VADEPFDALPAPGWAVANNQARLAGITAVPDAPYSPANALQLSYPRGFAGGKAAATMFRSLPDSRRVYVGLWWKANPDWQGHIANANKLQFLFTRTGGNLTIGIYGPPGGPYQLRTALQFVGADSRNLLPANAAYVPVRFGEWHLIEWFIDYTGGGRGTVRWWLDGQLIGDYTDVRFPSGGMIEYQLSPTWGGLGDTKRQDDFHWFDHVVVNAQ
jgi:hypothetical protein